jgi:hypothetical protein
MFRNYRSEEFRRVSYPSVLTYVDYFTVQQAVRSFFIILNHSISLYVSQEFLSVLNLPGISSDFLAKSYLKCSTSVFENSEILQVSWNRNRYNQLLYV